MCLFSSMLSNAKSNRLGPFMPRSSTLRGSCLYKMDLSVEAFIKYALKLKKKRNFHRIKLGHRRAPRVLK